MPRIAGFGVARGTIGGAVQGADACDLRRGVRVALCDLDKRVEEHALCGTYFREYEEQDVCRPQSQRAAPVKRLRDLQLDMRAAIEHVLDGTGGFDKVAALWKPFANAVLPYGVHGASNADYDVGKGRHILCQTRDLLKRMLRALQLPYTHRCDHGGVGDQGDVCVDDASVGWFEAVQPIKRRRVR